MVPISSQYLAYATPGNTEVENRGQDLPGNNINFRIADPDAIKSILIGFTEIPVSSCPNSLQIFVGLDKDVQLPRQLTVIDCEGDMDTTIWQLSVGDAVCIEGSCLPQVIGGEIIPIDATSLILAGAQMNAAWIIPVLAAAGIGAFILRKKF